MSVLFITLVFLCLVVFVFSAEGLQYCTEAQQTLMPCLCCKKECWYGATQLAEEYFGHMPGDGGQSETDFTLHIMKQCIEAECGEFCKQ